MLRFEIGHREGGQKIGQTFVRDKQTNRHTDKHRSLLYRFEFICFHFFPTLYLPSAGLKGTNRIFHTKCHKLKGHGTR